jgi:hypothetical protein
MKEFRRIKILSAVFVVLTIVAFFALKKKSINYTDNKEASSIAIKDTSSIYKITFEKNGYLQTLNKPFKGEWQINNKYEARTRWIQTLLVGLSKLEIKRPVAEENKARVLNLLKEKGVKVKVYNGDIVKNFTLESNDNDPNSTYLLEEGGGVPYIVYVPGITGDITALFKFNESDWRSRKLIGGSIRGLKSIKVDYPGNTKNDFEIAFQGGGIQLSKISKLDTFKLLNYLDQYQYVPLLYFIANKDSVQKTIEKSKPYASITLDDIRTEKCNTIYIYKNPGDKKQYLGIIAKGNEPVMLKAEIFDKLLVNKSYFEAP